MPHRRVTETRKSVRSPDAAHARPPADARLDALEPDFQCVSYYALDPGFFMAFRLGRYARTVLLMVPM